MRTRFFTLIELIVVLAIIMLIMGLVVPRVGRLPQGLLVKTTTSRLTSAFRDAALRARAQGATVRLVYDPEQKLLSLEQDQAAPLGSRGRDGRAAQALFRSKRYKLPRGGHLAMEEAADEDVFPAFVFQADGGASGPPLLLTVGRLKYRLEVDALTGRPRLIPIQGQG